MTKVRWILKMVSKTTMETKNITAKAEMNVKSIMAMMVTMSETKSNLSSANRRLSLFLKNFDPN